MCGVLHHDGDYGDDDDDDDYDDDDDDFYNDAPVEPYGLVSLSPALKHSSAAGSHSHLYNFYF